MTENFVSFDLAKKLKEKGYPQRTFGEYDMQGACYIEDGRFYENGCITEVARACTAPTISQVLKWLREEMIISVEPYSSASGWRVTICRAYHQDITDAGGGTCLKSAVEEYNDGGAFEKYEEASLAGIEYCLDKLI